ncbi:unnamed protein product [Schistosoma mattheei]|uniref:Uncharacterized protein n=1 Tax=Schistosoma mattheei TaxID=31246 RepID=A0A183Q402_9TREM|nr:unnamed protein product [Schistosoma mattheei]
MIPTSLSMNKYDSIPFGQQSYQNISFPYYMQENLHVSPYIHGFDTSNKVYSSFNPISSTTNFINSNKTNIKSNHLSEDISLLSSSSSSSTLSSSSPSTCSPLSSSLITSTNTTSTITTTINSMYTNFPNTMHLLTSKSFPLNNNNNHSNNSQLMNHINTVNNHDRLSFTNLFNHKELFSSRMNCNNDNYEQITSSNLLTSNDLLTGTLNKINHFHYGTNIDSITDNNNNNNNNNNQQRLPFISEVNNHNSTTSITVASTMTLSTINSLWSSQLKQLTRLDESRLDMSSDQIVSSSGGGSVIPFQQFINSSLSIPFTTTDNNNNNTINNCFNNISSKLQPNETITTTTTTTTTVTTTTTTTTDNQISNTSSLHFTQDDIQTLSSTLWSNERLNNNTYNTELNHNAFYQPIYNSMHTMPTR